MDETKGNVQYTETPHSTLYTYVTFTLQALPPRLHVGKDTKMESKIKCNKKSHIYKHFPSEI